MPRTTSASCTSNRPSTAIRGRSGRLSTLTSHVPQTLTTSVGSSAMSRTQCCSSLSGTMGSSELLLSDEKQEEIDHSCHCLDYCLSEEPDEARIFVYCFLKKNTRFSLNPVQSASEEVENNGTGLCSSLTSPAIINPLTLPCPLMVKKPEDFQVVLRSSDCSSGSKNLQSSSFLSASCF